MEMMEQNQTVEFEQMDFELLEEVEEVITPAVGTVLCCTN